MKPSPPAILASALKRFLGDYLPQQRAYSAHTILSYRDSWKLLLQFAAGKRRRVADLAVPDLVPATITNFLNHLETTRGNGAATRNVRLSAVHSFFEYLGAQYPEHLEQAQRVLSIPFKRTNHRTRVFLLLDSSKRFSVLAPASATPRWAGLKRSWPSGSSFSHAAASSGSNRRR